MRSLKEYLAESKKTFDFRIKIAGDLGYDDSYLKSILEKYLFLSVSIFKESIPQ